MPAATITPPGPILSASVTLTSAQVLAIFTTPVTVVPAPGAGLAIVPIIAIYDYVAGTTPYTDGGGSLRINVGNVFGLAQLTTASFWTAASSRVSSVNAAIASVVQTTNLANGALTVSSSTANPTLGNGTVAVTVAYMVVPVA